MKNILLIAKRDFKNIVSNQAAMIVILALIFLPSLYAWFNIKASWDPYANTEDVMVAISSLDEGAVVQDKEVNIGDEVIVNLSENDELGWTFVSEEEAIKGVEQGEYYAAIVIPEDFSEKLVSVTTDDVEKSELDYYINEKVNAISPKVTASGASAIVENIHTSFLKEANETVVTALNKIGFELEHNYVDIEKARDAVFTLEDEIPNIYAQIQLLDERLAVADEAVDVVDSTIDRVESYKDRAKNVNRDLIKRLDTSEANVEQVIDTITNRLNDAQATINKIPTYTKDVSEKGSADLNRLIQSLKKRQNSLKGVEKRLEAIHQFLKEQDKNLKQSTRLDELQSSLSDSKQNLQDLIAQMESFVRELEEGNHPGLDRIEKVEQHIQSFSDKMAELVEIYESILVPNVQYVIEEGEQFVTTVYETIDQIEDFNERALEAVQRIIESEDPAVEDVIDRLGAVSTVIQRNLERTERIVNILTVMNDFTDNERIEQLLDRFESLQETLKTSLSIVNQIYEILNAGDEPDDNLFTQLEQVLIDVSNKITAINDVFNEETIQALNDVVQDLRALDTLINEKIKEIKQLEHSITESVDDLKSRLENPKETIHLINRMIDRLEEGVNHIDRLSDGVNRIDQFIKSDFITNEIDRILVIRDELRNTNDSIDLAIERIEGAKRTGQNYLNDVDRLANDMNESINGVIRFVNGDLLERYRSIINGAKDSLENISTVLDDVDEKLPSVRKALEKADKGITKGQEKIDVANDYFPEARETVEKMAQKIRDLEDKGDLNDLINILTTDPVEVSEFLAEPILLNEHELYPIPNYGSAMNPFYTTLALWVGGLLLISSLKVDIHEKEKFKSFEVYGGRLITFLSIGILQSLIVTLGNIFLINAYIVNKFFYVLFGMLISIVFMTIIYTLVSVFGNTGKVLAIILLVMQLGGSGGTFPIQMAPSFFQKIYNFVPFTHSINLLRESIGGIIWIVVLKHILFLIIYLLIALGIGIGLKRIVNKSSDEFAEKARESEIVM